MAQQDLPLDLVVLADLGLGEGHAASGRLHRIEPDGFAAWMAALNPRTTIGAGGSPRLLAFADPRAFRPESLAERIPEAQALLALRAKLSQRGLERQELEAVIAGLPDDSPLKAALADRAATGVGAAPPPVPPPVPPAPADKPAAPAPPATSSGGDPLDALFDMVDVGGAAPPAEGAPRPAAPVTPASHALDRLVAMLGASHAGRADSATQAGLAKVVDESLGETIRAALEDPAFRAIEQTWAGLRFLIRRVDFRSGVRLHVLPTTLARLVRDARGILAPFTEATRQEARVVVALADFDLAGDDAGLALAADLAEIAAGSQVPLVAAAAPGLFGIGDFREIYTVENVDDRLADDAHAGWNALRASEDARWLALVANRFLLRLPYGAEGDRVKGFAFEEHPPDREPGHLWGRGIWAVGERLAASFARCGWGVQITGQDEDAAVADLPVRLTRLRTGEILPSPLETQLSERRALEFSQAGVIALLARRGADAAFMATAPMVHGGRGGATSSGEARRNALPFMMFVTQVMAWFAHLDGAGRFASAEERRTALARGIQFLSMTGEGPTLEASVAGDAIVFTPWRPPLRGLPDFTLQVGGRG